MWTADEREEFAFWLRWYDTIIPDVEVCIDGAQGYQQIFPNSEEAQTLRKLASLAVATHRALHMPA